MIAKLNQHLLRQSPLYCLISFILCFNQLLGISQTLRLVYILILSYRYMQSKFNKLEPTDNKYYKVFKKCHTVAVLKPQSLRCVC